MAAAMERNDCQLKLSAFFLNSRSGPATPPISLEFGVRVFWCVIGDLWPRGSPRRKDVMNTTRNPKFAECILSDIRQTTFLPSVIR